MGIFDAIILGLVQGVTEFLPISSSGHLILVRDLFGFEIIGSLAFDAVLHLATALAVVVYFRRQIWEALSGRNNTLLLAIILGTIPAVIAGFLFENLIETYLRSGATVAISLLLGSFVFVIAEHLGKKDEVLSVKKGVWVGLYQMLAFVPGLSRSGMSISGGMLFGMNRKEATDFAFLLGLPAILGVGGLKLIELFSVGFENGAGMTLSLGSLVAFLSGLLAIHFMVKFVENHSLHPFVVYRVVLAFAVLFFI